MVDKTWTYFCYIFGSYHCHMMNLVVNAIQDLGVEVKHIPGGCTSLCQPVDIGINKPFKAFLRKAWEKWMIDEGIRSGTSSPPTRELIAKWASYVKDQSKKRIKEMCGDMNHIHGSLHVIQMRRLKNCF